MMGLNQLVMYLRMDSRWKKEKIMKKFKFLMVPLIVLALLVVQTGGVFAAPELQEGFITGAVTAITCEIDPDTLASTFYITVEVADGVFETVHVDQATAEALGVVTANTVCNSDGTVTGADLSIIVSIDPATIIPTEEEPQHPVGAALALFFSDATDYDTIMSAHDDGTGFGLIAQALWLTIKMEGDSETFLAIIEAKKTKDFSAFVLDDGSTPTNWGQFKKAALNGDKKNNLGVVMSHKNNEDKTNNGNGQNKDKSNNGKSEEKKKDK